MLQITELTAGKVDCIAADEYTPGKAYLVIKRCFDFWTSLILLIVLLPLFCIIAILIKLEDGGPVIHKRTCVSKNGSYNMLKFRTMVTDAENLEKYLTPEQIKGYEKNFKIIDDPRVTRLGHFMRVTSIDELPQLFNVLRNDMSLVGLRPMVKEELDYYGENSDEVLAVKPGITGYWQVNGRSECTYENGKRQRLEMYYVCHRSLWLDVKILLKTVKIVLTREGAR